jgi:hypothetical protein
MKLMSTFACPPFRIDPNLNSYVFVIQGCDMYPRDALNGDSFYAYKCTRGYWISNMSFFIIFDQIS